MFKNKYEKEYEGYVIKEYASDVGIYEAMDQIVYSDISFSRVNVSEDVDVGMGYYGGQYLFDKFVNKYEEMKYEIDKLTLFFADMPGSISIDTDDNSIVLLTDNRLLDLNELVKKNDLKSK